MQPAITETDERELDAFWSQKPRPMTPINPAYTPGAVTMTTTCRVCDKRSQQAIGTPGLICNECRSNLDAVRAKLAKQRQQLQDEEATVSERWINRQAALPDELAARWYRLCQDKQTIDAKVQAAQTAKNGNLDIIAALKAEQAEIYSRIERTRLKGGELAQLINEDATWQKQRAAFTERRIKLNQADQEIQAVHDDEVPF